MGIESRLAYSLLHNEFVPEIKEDNEASDCFRHSRMPSTLDGGVTSIRHLSRMHKLHFVRRVACATKIMHRRCFSGFKVLVRRSFRLFRCNAHGIVEHRISSQLRKVASVPKGIRIYRFLGKINRMQIVRVKSKGRHEHQTP